MSEESRLSFEHLLLLRQFLPLLGTILTKRANVVKQLHLRTPFLLKLRPAHTNETEIIVTKLKILTFGKNTEILKKIILNIAGIYNMEALRVIPFGLTNAPSVFQHLMQRVLSGLNPEEGRDFISVYIDDVLVFSQNLGDHLKHLKHLKLVIDRLQTAGLKLKPSKCQFLRREVDYLGHMITPHRLKTNPRLVSAVSEFRPPAVFGRHASFWDSVRITGDLYPCSLV